MTLNFRAKIDFSNSKKIRILAHRIYLSAKNSNIFEFRDFYELYLVTFKVRQYSVMLLFTNILGKTARKLLIVFNFHVIYPQQSSIYSQNFYDLLGSCFSHIRSLCKVVAHAVWMQYFFEKLQSFLGQAGDKVAQNIALADVKLATLIIHGHC